MRSAFVRFAVIAIIGIVPVMITACGSSSSNASSDANGSGSGKLTRVNIETEPYFDYKFFDVAHAEGIDKEFGLDLNITTTAQQYSWKSLVRGDVDVAASCPTCLITALKNLPNLRDFMVMQVFKGFVPVGRAKNGVPARKTYAQFLKENGGDQEAALDAFAGSLKGSSWAIAPELDGPLVRLMLKRGGLTMKDIKVIAFPDETTSALAFIRGSGDYYFGSLPQTLRLVTAPELKDKFVIAGSYRLFPPAFGNFAATQEWLDKHEDTALRLWAVWLRAVRYLYEKPDPALKVIAGTLKEATGGLLTPAQTKTALTEFEYYPRFADVQKTFFDPSSESYFAAANKDVFQSAADEGTIPKDLATGETVEVAEKYWKKLQQRKDLIDKINAPLP